MRNRNEVATHSCKTFQDTVDNKETAPVTSLCFLFGRFPDMKLSALQKCQAERLLHRLADLKFEPKMATSPRPTRRISLALNFDDCSQNTFNSDIFFLALKLHLLIIYIQTPRQRGQGSKPVACDTVVSENQNPNISKHLRSLSVCSHFLQISVRVHALLT